MKRNKGEHSQAQRFQRLRPLIENFNNAKEDHEKVKIFEEFANEATYIKQFDEEFPGWVLEFGRQNIGFARIVRARLEKRITEEQNEQP